MCRLAGYVEVTLWSVSIYTFMWISVDRYLAVRKPLRYETISSTVDIFSLSLLSPSALYVRTFNKKAIFTRERRIASLDYKI